MADPKTSMDPLSWRTPPAYTAILFLCVSVCAALNIYWHPSATLRLVTLVLGIVAFCWAIAGMRMFLEADDDGVEVRYVGRRVWLPWSEIARIEVVSGVRGAQTVRFSRRDGTFVDVAPSLLQPTKPTKRPVATARLKAIAAQLEERRHAA